MTTLKIIIIAILFLGGLALAPDYYMASNGGYYTMEELNTQGI